MPTSPTVARWELSLRLRQLRQDRDLSTNDVASALGFTRNYWSLVENDRTLIAADKLVALAELFELPADELDLLLDLRETGRERGWWMEYRDIMTDDVQRFYGLEYGASSLRAYEGQIINGLLQTEAYARYLMESDPLVPDVHVNQLIQVRKRRQARLTSEDPLQITVIMNQKALMQQVGHPSVLHDQLDHLIRLIETSKTTDIRIVPFNHPEGSATGSPTLYMLDYDREVLPTVSWIEAALPISMTSDQQVAFELSLRFEDAQAAALSRGDSLELILKLSHELGG